MNKKIIFIIVTLLLFILFVVLGILRYRSQRAILNEPVPVVPTKTNTATSKPAAQITQEPGIAKQTDVAAATKLIPDNVSLIEKDKIFDYLPLRLEDFATSADIKTTINIFSFAYDPNSAIRIEIYGINYNDSTLTGPNAIAFKESFLEAKKKLSIRGVDLKNLQIIYGNRQYIQDTANYWVSAFQLLD